MAGKDVESAGKRRLAGKRLGTAGIQVRSAGKRWGTAGKDPELAGKRGLAGKRFGRPEFR
ncbi:hypothetical protein CEF21_14685 [Bacillus sp. FJAT-42376]|nr:hypothetical protein CEF21_14685 [Bacillus sp. FJAT-42376]